MATSFELSISKDYVPKWGLVEAVRELYQNALDQGSVDTDYDEATLELTISSKAGILTRDTLLFGATSKAGDSSKIGQFGEGYKLAMLVLTREDYPVHFKNYGLKEIWKPRFKVARRLNNAELLCIDITALRGSVQPTGLDVIISNVSNDDYMQIISTNLNMLEHYENSDNAIMTEKGNLLLHEDQRGMIYVKGLAVGHVEGIHFGYDFIPGLLELNRDRDMVRNWELQWATAKVLRLCPEEIIEECIRNEYDDIKGVNMKYESKVNDIAAKVGAEAIKTLGSDVIPVTTIEEMQTAKLKYGATKNIQMVTEIVKDALVASGELEEPSSNIESKLRTAIMSWIDSWDYQLSESSMQELLEIVEENE